MEISPAVHNILGVSHSWKADFAYLNELCSYLE